MSPGNLPSGTPNRIARPAAMKTMPMTINRRDMALSRSSDFHPPEEVSQLERRRLGCVGSVRRVVLDRRAELLAQGPGVGLGRIGRAHQRPPLLDRVGRLEGHDDARPGGHEIREAAEERPRAMHGVEPFGVLLAEMSQSKGLDAES